MEAKPLGPLVVIVGPTASGKSALGMEVARKYNGEIIAADSRTVYKGLDIGTAKPSKQDRQEIPHHLIDVVEPDQTFTAGQFKKLANQAIASVTARGRLPIMVGGTGLYIDGILFDYQFGASDAERRVELNQMTVDELTSLLRNSRFGLPTDVRNKRHLVRAIEQEGVNKQRQATHRPNTIVVGIATSRSLLRQAIVARAEYMFSEYVVKEATDIAKKYGWHSEAMSGNIYPILRRLQAGEIDEEEARTLFITADMQLAKRQMTWLQRNPYIRWFAKPEDALEAIEHFLTTPKSAPLS